MPKDEGSCPWFSDEKCSNCSKHFRAYDNQIDRWTPDNCPDPHKEYICFKCRDSTYNPDYFSKEGFWDVWEWLNYEEKLNDFMVSACPTINVIKYGESIFYDEIITDIFNIINYKTFAREVFDFLEGKK
jgi:hypothetical protein